MEENQAMGNTPLHRTRELMEEERERKDVESEEGNMVHKRRL